MSEKKGSKSIPTIIDLKRATREEWQEVWDVLPALLFNKDAFVQWQQFLGTRPTLEQVRIRRANAGIPVRHIEFEQLDQIESYPAVKHIIGMNPRMILSQMYPALSYTFTPSGQLLTISDDHIGATQTKLALLLGGLNLSDAPYEEVNIDAHHDRGYFYDDSTVVDAMAWREFGTWRKILEGNGLVKKDHAMERWLNSKESIEAANERHTQTPLDICFFDFDLFIPAPNPEAAQLAVDFQSVQQPVTSLLRQAKVVNLSTSTGNFSNQDKIPGMLTWVKNVMR